MTRGPMSKVEELRDTFEANIACGDLSEREIDRMLDMIAQAEVEQRQESAH